MILERLCRVLRVPPEPAPPEGAPGSLRTFRAARGFYLYSLFQWGLAQAGAAVGLVMGAAFLRGVPDVTVLGFSLHWILNWLEVLAVVGFVFQLPFGPLIVRLNYQMRWYMVTDRSLRIREGILRVRERTMSFSNIQNLTLQQGPLQRLLGIEDLRVRTAGGGESHEEEKGGEAGSDSMHVGFFRGVEDAASIRDLILAQLRVRGDGGSGEPAPEAHRRSTTPDVAQAALRGAAEALRDEAAALGRAFAHLGTPPASR